MNVCKIQKTFAILRKLSYFPEAVTETPGGLDKTAYNTKKIVSVSTYQNLQRKTFPQKMAYSGLYPGPWLQWGVGGV